MDASCNNCFFYIYSRMDRYAGQLGHCRYNPPVYDELTYNKWPSVTPNSWCGKHRSNL